MYEFKFLSKPVRVVLHFLTSIYYNYPFLLQLILLDGGIKSCDLNYVSTMAFKIENYVTSVGHVCVFFWEIIMELFHNKTLFYFSENFYTMYFDTDHLLLKLLPGRHTHPYTTWHPLKKEKKTFESKWCFLYTLEYKAIME